VVECSGSRLVDLAATEALGRKSAGWWECDLTDDGLTWTAGVYNIFGLPQGSHLVRADVAGLYAEESRARMERLRAQAVATGSGFALDAIIKPGNGGSVRWMRLIGCPVIEGGRVARLQGLKLLI
jgi:hypothetical protein